MEFITYNDLKKSKNSLSFIDCEKIHLKILNEGDLKDTEFQKVWQDFVLASVEYATIRGKWLFLSREEKIDTDEHRSICHNKVIYQLKFIKGLIAEKNGDTTWFSDFHEDRKRIGDFACFVSYIYGINAR